MLGPPDAEGTDSYVLGEINTTSVFPIPDEAPAEIARRVADRLRSTLSMVREPYDGEPTAPWGGFPRPRFWAFDFLEVERNAD